MNLTLCYYNDGKNKSESHECYFRNNNTIEPVSITDISGYGATREEAMEDMRRQLNELFKELHAVESMVFGTNYYDDNYTEVDCFGNPK